MTGRQTILVLVLCWGSGVNVLQAQTHRVDAIFREWDRSDSPGCALGVVQNGQLAYERGYGVANIHTGKPVTTETVFYLASVSKQFTAATMALLALDGRIDLDADVRNYVPELPDYGDRITIRHLIHHTSGLRDYLTLMELAGMALDEEHSRDEVLDLISRQGAPNFTPGERHLYSNTGYFLIPIIVERVTGQSLRRFADERIFGPLGMALTHFHDDFQHQLPNRALSYRRTSDGLVELAFLEKFDQVGSGGVLSTVRDLARWDRNFYDPDVGGEPFLALLHRRGDLTDGDTLSYAFGLRIADYKGLRTVSHGGSMMGFKTHILRFPDQRFSVICLCNLEQIDPGDLAHRVADVYLAYTFDRTLQDFAGEYYASELGMTWSLQVREGDLFLEQPDTTLALASAGGDAFTHPRGATLRFTRDAGGPVTGFSLDAGRVSGLQFVKRR